jgi:hypothetical protein
LDTSTSAVRPPSTPEPVLPAVSVLIPCWNAAASIERALGSLLDERDVALECVVVDDGSTDGTADVVRAIAARDPRVVLLEAPANEGVSAARNRGLHAVRGEWLTFLDADDRLLPGGLAAMHRAAVATGALAVVGQRIWSDGVTTWISPHYDRPDIRLPGRKSLRRNPGLLFYASGTGKLFHRSCWQDLWFEGRVLGDQPWTVCALLRAGDRIEVIGDVVYEWTRPGPGNEFTSITAAKHDSARLAAVAVRVAIGAFRQVADEAERSLPDPADRRIVVAGYFDRLVRADFTGPVARATSGRDEGTVELFEALVAFLRAAPPDIVGRSPAVAWGLVVPPIANWRRLSPTIRAATWSVVSTAAGAARDRRAAPARPAVDALLGLLSIAAGPLMRVRAIRRIVWR